MKPKEAAYIVFGRSCAERGASTRPEVTVCRVVRDLLLDRRHRSDPQTQCKDKQTAKSHAEGKHEKQRAIDSYKSASTQKYVSRAGGCRCDDRTELSLTQVHLIHVLYTRLGDRSQSSCEISHCRRTCQWYLRTVMRSHIADLPSWQSLGAIGCCH